MSRIFIYFNLVFLLLFISCIQEAPENLRQKVAKATIVAKKTNLFSLVRETALVIRTVPTNPIIGSPTNPTIVTTQADRTGQTDSDLITDPGTETDTDSSIETDTQIQTRPPVISYGDAENPNNNEAIQDYLTAQIRSVQNTATMTNSTTLAPIQFDDSPSAPTVVVLFGGDLMISPPIDWSRNTTSKFCNANKPALCTSSTSAVALLGYAADHGVQDVPANYGVPTNVPIVSSDSTQIAANWSGLFLTR